MSDAAYRLRAHYSGVRPGMPGLLEQVRQAVEAMAPDGRPVPLAWLEDLDQFHTRRLAATTDLARDVALRPGERVLDLGCGFGGPARVMAATCGVTVTGLDQSEAFIATGRYLTERCGLADTVSLAAGDATRTGFADGSFDVVVLQHVGMNMADRGPLYREAARVLRPGGRLALTEVAQGVGDLVFPVTWARDAEMHHALTPAATRAAVDAAGLEVALMRDDTERSLSWAAQRVLMGPQRGPCLMMALGHEVPVMTGNLMRNLREGRARVITIVAHKAGPPST